MAGVTVGVVVLAWRVARVLADPWVTPDRALLTTGLGWLGAYLIGTVAVTAVRMRAERWRWERRRARDLAQRPESDSAARSDAGV